MAKARKKKRACKKWKKNQRKRGGGHEREICNSSAYQTSRNKTESEFNRCFLMLLLLYCCFCPFYSFICLQSWFFLVPCRSVLSFKMRAILKVFSAFWWFAQEIWLILFVNVIHLFVVYSIGTAETAIQSIVRTIEVSLFLFNLFMGIFQSLLPLLLLWCSRARSAVNSFVLCHV